MKNIFLILLALCTLSSNAQLQDNTNPVIIDYDEPQKYEIGGIEVSGNTFTPDNIIVLVAGLTKGQSITIPGDDISLAIDKLWKQQRFSDIEIGILKTEGSKIFLNIHVKERPRLSKYSIKGLKKAETNNVRDEISLTKNQLITEDLVNATRREIKEYFHEKGYYTVNTTFKQEEDPEKPNYQILRIDINRGKKVMLQDIVFAGNDNVEDKKLRKLLKPKRKYKKLNLFASSKFVTETYEETKPAILQTYSSLGYRDASLLYDSVVQVAEDRVVLKIGINEGIKYYFRDIKWTGNTKYRTSLLDTLLGIKRGDVYDQSKLESKLFMSENGFDISSL